MKEIPKPQILFTETEIQKRVMEIASELNVRFKDKVPIFICVLNGASIFFSDLIRSVQFDVECDFLSVSSYKDFKSTGQVKILSDIDLDVKDRDIVLVEDIIDSGLTINFLQDIFKLRKAGTITTVSLLYKPEAVENKCEIDYTGFKIGNEFVVGYGLDYNHYFRNLPYIGVLSQQN